MSLGCRICSAVSPRTTPGCCRCLKKPSRNSSPAGVVFAVFASVARVGAHLPPQIGQGLVIRGPRTLLLGPARVLALAPISQRAAQPGGHIAPRGGIAERKITWNTNVRDGFDGTDKVLDG